MEEWGLEHHTLGWLGGCQPLVCPFCPTPRMGLQAVTSGGNRPAGLFSKVQYEFCQPKPHKAAYPPGMPFLFTPSSNTAAALSLHTLCAHRGRGELKPSGLSSPPGHTLAPACSHTAKTATARATSSPTLLYETDLDLQSRKPFHHPTGISPRTRAPSSHYSSVRFSR